MKRLDNLRKFSRKWYEIWLAPLFVVMYFMSSGVILRLDKQAGIYDPAVFQKVIVVIGIFLVVHIFVWLLIKFTWKNIYSLTTDEEFDKIIFGKADKLSDWQKLVAIFWLFSLYLLVITLMMLAF